MTLELAYPSFPDHGTTTAFGSEALALVECERRLTVRTNDDKGALLQELETVASECSAPGWDGYGAEAVSLMTYRLAHCFALAMPYGVPIPTVGATSDGHMTLEWYRDPMHVLSVSVGPEGRFFFAAKVDSGRRSGSEMFGKSVPEDILRIILQLFRN